MYLLILFNLIFLTYCAYYDWKTHTVLRVLTLLYFCVGVLSTNTLYMVESIILVITMWISSKYLAVSSGDRKIIFSQSLMYGGMLGFLQLFGIIVAIAIFGRNGKNVALIPFILVIYILYLRYYLGVL